MSELVMIHLQHFLRAKTNPLFEASKKITGRGIAKHTQYSFMEYYSFTTNLNGVSIILKKRMSVTNACILAVIIQDKGVPIIIIHINTCILSVIIQDKGVPIIIIHVHINTCILSVIIQDKGVHVSINNGYIKIFIQLVLSKTN